MAKTLIGNIKGKDGRGIASIRKTGTTGSVDTYTITYTDSTTSTFTINNSDNISLQRQIVPSAAIESSTTASQPYTSGDYVVVSGVLRKVKSAIAKGGAISDSNSTATTVTGELATLGDSVSSASIDWKAPYTDSKIQFERVGNAVFCHGNVKFTSSVECNYLDASEKLPEGFRPIQSNTAVVFSFAGNFALLFDKNGRVSMLGNPKSAYACCTGSWYTRDKFPG